MALESVLQQALALPAKERGELAAVLLRSLEPANEALTAAEHEAMWTDTIERRLRDLDEGRATTISYEEFQHRVRARLPQP